MRGGTAAYPLFISMTTDEAALFMAAFSKYRKDH